MLAILVISSAGECVDPNSLKRTQSYQTVVGGTEGSQAVLSNDIIRHDLQCVDAGLVKKYAAEYGMDFRLILAMIKQESHFDEDALSERGAQGLMQIMPATHSELSDELEIVDPLLPRENLRTGVYYVSKISELFSDAKEEDKIGLVLAAYNAGPARIYDAQMLAAYLGENPRKWSSIRNVLPLLSKRYYSLHTAVWNKNRPPNGYFGGARQTIQYVDNIIRTYQAYRQPA